MNTHTDSKVTYPKQTHTFVQNDFCNPEGPINAIVYNGINDPQEPYANFIIEDWQGTPAAVEGRYYLQLENAQFQSDDLTSLEARLFDWMSDEGVEPLAQ
jgi:hypothetical protein